MFVQQNFLLPLNSKKWPHVLVRPSGRKSKFLVSYLRHTTLLDHSGETHEPVTTLNTEYTMCQVFKWKTREITTVRRPHQEATQANNLASWLAGNVLQEMQRYKNKEIIGKNTVFLRHVIEIRSTRKNVESHSQLVKYRRDLQSQIICISRLGKTKASI